MARKRILIAYGNAGAGHVKASHAVNNALREMSLEDVEIKMIDTLDYSTGFLKKWYPAVYLFLVNKLPSFWGLCYYLFDTRIIYKLFIGPARRAQNLLNCKKLEEFLRQYNPDIAINTHFLGSEVMADMKRRGILKNTKLISVVTDYLMHSFWVDRDIDYYCVAQEASKEHLMKRGIPPEKIRVFGIPVDRVFSTRKDKGQLCAKLGIKDNCSTVLIGSGGFGVGPIEELVKELSGAKQCRQLLVVCGKNPKLHKEISEFAGSSETAIKAYGFVDNMDELMEVSDIIVTKSGGMTSSEAMAKGLPMIITSAIPGQEARNCKYLVKAGAAIHAGGVGKTKEAIVGILSSDARMKELKARISEIKKPNSASDIARFALSLL